MMLTTIRLNRSSAQVRADVADLCRMHSRIIDATVGMPEGGPRVLWAQPRRDLLVIRAPELVTTARLPRGYAASIQHRPWQPPDHPGRWVMNAVLNPARHNKIGGPTANNPGRPYHDGQPVLYKTAETQAMWLARRIEGANLRGYMVVDAQVARGRHRTGRTVTARRLSIRAEWQVADPAAMADRLHAGVGMDKTWGCGLTLWAPAAGR
jgi:hypothetical protein